MIDSAKFWPEWQRICKRFGRTAEASEAGDYLEYLDACGLDTQQAVEAARMVWATARFFPRPSDFLQGEAAAGWTLIQEYAHRQFAPHNLSAPAPAELASQLREAIPSRSRAAILALGGYRVVHEARDLPKIRREYFDAFEQVVVEETMVPRLKAPETQLALPRKFQIDDGPSRIDVALLKQLAGIEVEGGAETATVPVPSEDPAA